MTTVGQRVCPAEAIDDVAVQSWPVPCTEADAIEAIYGWTAT